MRSQIPVNAGALDANERAEVETRPIWVLHAAIRTVLIAGE